MPIWTPQHTPSYKQGFARNASQSNNPGLWKGLAGLWMPGLGPTGLSLRDISGHGNHGTLTNMDPATDWVLGDPRYGGWALEFSAITEHVLLPALTFADNWTIAVRAWWNVTSTAWSHDTPLAFAVGNDQIMIKRSGDALTSWQCRARKAEPYQIVDCNGTVEDGPLKTWFLLVGTCRNGIIQLYVDGKAQGTSSGTWAQTVTAAGYLANTDAVSETYAFPGKTSFAWAYNRALIPSEIQQLYEDPLAMVRPRAKVFPAAAVGSVELVVGDAKCVVESENVGLTQHHAITVGNSECVVESEQPAFTQHQALSVDDSECVVESDGIAITQHQVLAVDDSECVVASANVVLSFGNQSAFFLAM